MLTPKLACVTIGAELSPEGIIGKTELQEAAVFGRLSLQNLRHVEAALCWVKSRDCQKVAQWTVTVSRWLCPSQASQALAKIQDRV